MNNCVGCSNRSKSFRQWFRTKMKCASSEGTRYWITRLQRAQDHQYHELRNENDKLRQELANQEKELDKMWKALQAAAA